MRCLILTLSLFLSNSFVYASLSNAQTSAVTDAFRTNFEHLGFSIEVSVDPGLAYDGRYERQRYPEVAKLAKLLKPYVLETLQEGIRRISGYNPSFAEYARQNMMNRSIHMLFDAGSGFIQASFHVPGVWFFHWPLIRPTIKMSASHASAFVFAIRNGFQPHPFYVAEFQNTVFHEFLHFLDLPISENHNESDVQTRDDDTVYACAGLAFPTLGIFYVPRAPEQILEPRRAGETSTFTSAESTRQACRTCVLWRPGSPSTVSSQIETPDEAAICDSLP